MKMFSAHHRPLEPLQQNWRRDGAHIKVEDILQELAGATEQIFVVTAVPDEKKGERLIVLHTLDDPQLEECLAKLGNSDLPALWRPRKDQFLRIETLPYLGTGNSICAKRADWRWR